MSWGKIYCDTNWGENKYRTAGSIINEATPDCFQFPEFVTFKDHVRTEGATYEQMQCGIDILLFLGRSISITPKSPDNPTFSGILDTYTGATAGYSTRRLTNTYTGGLIRVRRSSDDAEQDIGYDANGEDLDIFGLLAFVNAEYTFVDEDFASSTGWILGSGTSITDGVLRANTTSFVLSYKPYVDTGAQQVRVTFTISNYVSGTVTYRNFGGGATGTARSANGTYTETLTLNAGGNANHGFQFDSSFVGDIDDFEIVQLTADGAVTTFYDQSGNGNNATNSTASEQPLIVDGGSIIYEGATISRPAIDFTSVNGLRSSVNFGSNTSIFSVFKNADTQGVIYSGTNIGSDFIYAFRTNTGGIASGVTIDATYKDAALQSLTNQTSVLNAINTGSQLLWSSFLSSVDTARYSDLSIGAGVLGDTDIIWSEIIIFDSDQSSNRTGIEGNIDNYFRIT